MFAFNQLPPAFLHFSPSIFHSSMTIIVNNHRENNPYLCAIFHFFLFFFFFFFYSRIVILFEWSDSDERFIVDVWWIFQLLRIYIFLRDWFLTFLRGWRILLWNGNHFEQGFGSIYTSLIFFVYWFHCFAEPIDLFNRSMNCKHEIRRGGN